MARDVTSPPDLSTSIETQHLTARFRNMSAAIVLVPSAHSVCLYCDRHIGDSAGGVFV